MVSKDLNTLRIAVSFEKDLTSFAREHSTMIKQNLETIRRNEKDYFNALQELTDTYSQEKTDKEQAAKDTIKKAESKYNDAVKQAKEHYERVSAQIDKKCNDNIAALEEEMRHRNSFAKNIRETYNDYEKFFSMSNGYEQTKLYKSGLLWFHKYTELNDYANKYDNNYGSVFDKDNVDMRYIHEELVCLCKEVLSYSELSVFKKIQKKSKLILKLGNIHQLLQALKNYSQEIDELFNKNYSQKAKDDIKSENEKRANARMVEGKLYEQAVSCAADEKDKAIVETQEKLQPALEDIQRRSAAEKAQLNTRFEADKKTCEKLFEKSESELSKKILFCLESKYSIGMIDNLEKYKSHIDSYSEKEEYKPIEENKPYVRLGSVKFDYAHHQEIRDDLFIQNILNKYYHKLNNDGVFQIPYIIDFRDLSNIQLDCENINVNNTVPAVRSIIMRLFCDMMAGRVKFTFIDLVSQGQTFAPFMQFINTSPTSRNIINQGTCTDAKRADNLLESLEYSVKDINANIYTNEYSNVIEYNEVSEPNILPINIITIMNYPDQLSDEAIEHIKRIVRHSKRCGYHFIFVGNGNTKRDSQLSIRDILNDVQPNAVDSIDYTEIDPCLSRLKYISPYEYQNSGSSVVVHIDEMLTEAKMIKVAATLKEALEKSSSIKVPYVKINPEFNNRSAKNDIRLPFALVGASDVKSLIFGDKYARHAAVVGLQRSGKSNALHTLIISAMRNYSPDELQLYLLDYKFGIGAYEYSNYRLPHFKVISTTKNTMFGINVISSIEDVMQERTNLFNTHHCDNYSQYRTIRDNNPELRLPALPRLLIIIDEMHEMFNTNTDKIGNFSRLMKLLIRESPSYGIHMILSSQGVTDWKLDECLNLITSAIVLKCTKDTEHALLGEDSDVAQQIPQNEAGHAVYSADRQSPNNNQNVRIAYLDKENEAELLKQIENQYRNYECNTRVNAATLVNRIDNPIYKFVVENREEFSPDEITIGENLDLETNSQVKLAGNFMLIGDNREMARDFTETILISILCNNIVNKPSNKVYFIDLTEFKNETKQGKDVIYKLSQGIEEPYFRYFNSIQFSEASQIAFQSATDAKEESKAYIFIYGLSEQQGELLRDLLAIGNNNAHIICWCNTYEGFVKCLAKEYHGLMAHRLVFCSPEKNVELLTSRNCDLSASNYALYRDINTIFTAKEYSPYKITDDNWLEKLVTKLSIRD